MGEIGKRTPCELMSVMWEDQFVGQENQTEQKGKSDLKGEERCEEHKPQTECEHFKDEKEIVVPIVPIKVATWFE